jgi:hypothetical protein
MTSAGTLERNRSRIQDLGSWDGHGCKPLLTLFARQEVAFADLVMSRSGRFGIRLACDNSLKLARRNWIPFPIVLYHHVVLLPICA